MNSGDLNSLNVLVIDDQVSMRRIVRDLLKKSGISGITEASNGAIALARLSNPDLAKPDVIICDLHMEGMDGMAFCNVLRRKKSLGIEHIPVIILTGDSDPLLHEVAYQVGAMKVLTKPITALELADNLSTAIGFTIKVKPTIPPGC